ncbi:alcohol dehydrogenase catalytic domain-containing protein [Rhodococcus sp. OK302]|uniref:alcohol dehydrogenase catalytic domain-containing protein n=1 Tax=Rhodococcus sp. OK302 TaxID=1882769 RepID=UPI000B945E19|nr:alcohol dehydrogenase catalytic domain-containing protein [Rhodococcus sp. OK302]OYD61471.1 S-(hydroxymethyl)glutathione dehydrogenase/alcohol dehydrogenase [Rhodococcus sp. OK302]
MSANKSLAAVVTGRNQAWQVVEIDVSPPSAGEVLVEWAAAGLCHSDEHFRSGDRVAPGRDDDLFPMLGGHEAAGIVAEIGPGVTKFSVGDRVCASFSPICGTCTFCVSGRGSLCNGNKDFMVRGQLADGAHRHHFNGEPLYLMAKLGTFAERTVVAERSLLPIPDDVSFEAACLVSCGVSTGWGSAVERAGTRPGDVVVVVGTGGLGSAALQGARNVGAGQIIAVDPLPFRRDMAKTFGATHAVASIADAKPIVDELTWGQGADRVILTPSIVTSEILHDGLELTGKDGVLVVVGMGPLGETPVPIDIGSFALYNKQIRGSLFGALDPRVAVPSLLNLYRRGLLDLDSMITRYPLGEINRALSDQLEGRNIRAVLTMNGH